MASRKVLIIGGTKGIGYALAKQLTQENDVVTIVGRSTPADLPKNIFMVSADLSSMKESKALVTDKLKGSAFDVVVFSNGIITSKQLRRTKEGVEEDLAVSYLSRFVILNEMMKNSNLNGEKKVYVLGYPGEKNMNPIDADDINFDKDENKYAQMAAHMNTIIFNEAIVYEAARRFPTIKTFGLNPGLIQTNIRDNFHGGKDTWLGWFVEGMISLFAITPEKYAVTVSSIIKNADHPSCTFFSQKGAVITSKGWVTEEANRIKVWENSQALVDKAMSA